MNLSGLSLPCGCWVVVSFDRVFLNAVVVDKLSTLLSQSCMSEQQVERLAEGY